MRSIICQGDGYDESDDEADFAMLDLEDQLIYALRLPSNADDGASCDPRNWDRW